MATFPTLTRKGSKSGWLQTPNKNAVKVASAASGLPVVNKLFTFDGPTWKYVLKLVTSTDKDTLETFYGNNKDVPFDWLNPQDSNTYEVIFASPPRYTCGGSDGTNFYWNITLVITQYSPL
ncbi:hypothetical protein LCGC14_0561270 [marine sediment metagenome]|uniref:Uncharacterized protein n=1 Tax=marine sediment metagenome TaxID=412755 RepID=A0A0F9RLT5_9ZZZZ